MTHYIRELLLDNARDEPFDADYLERNLDHWLRRGTSYAPLLPRLVNLQLWWNTFLGTGSAGRVESTYLYLNGESERRG